MSRNREAERGPSPRIRKGCSEAWTQPTGGRGRGWGRGHIPWGRGTRDGGQGCASEECGSPAPVNHRRRPLAPGARASPCSCCSLCRCCWARLGTRPPSGAHRPASATTPGGTCPADTRTSARCPAPSPRSAGRAGVVGGGRGGSLSWHGSLGHRPAGEPGKVTLSL